jgi:hypothetical protein
LLRDAKPKAAEKASLTLATGDRIVAVIKRVGMGLRRTEREEGGMAAGGNCQGTAVILKARTLEDGASFDTPMSTQRGGEIAAVVSGATSV